MKEHDVVLQILGVIVITLGTALLAIQAIEWITCPAEEHDSIDLHVVEWSSSEEEEAKGKLDDFISHFDDWWENDNESPTQEVFLPREVKTNKKRTCWTESNPRMGKRVKAFLQRHSDLDLGSMIYGRDYIYALHGTPDPRLIQKSGLKAKAGAGDCGKGVYFALSAGVCKNTGDASKRTLYEFTTLKYGACPKGTRTELTVLEATTGLVIALVLKPRCNPVFSRSGLGYWFNAEIRSDNWAMADELNVLPIKIATVSTKELIQILWNKYGDCSENAEQTALFKKFSTDGEFNLEKVNQFPYKSQRRVNSHLEKLGHKTRRSNGRKSKR